VNVRGVGGRRAFDALSVVLLLFGETLSFLLVPHLSLWRFGPFFVLGVIAVAVRHLLWPTPHLAAVLWRWLVTPAGPDRSIALGIAAVTRIAVLVAGLGAVAAYGYRLQPGQPRLARSEVLNLPARFDAGWYMGIARHGYEWRADLRERQQPVAFFPAYPLATRAGGDLVTVPAKLFNAPGFLENGNTRVLWGGMLVSFWCVLAAACRILGLANLETGDRRRARWAVALVMLWPFAFFFSGVYTEAMLLMGMAGCILAWRQHRFGHAFGWGLLCGLTRPNGWTVAIALVADLLLRKNKWRLSVASVAAAVSPVLGSGIFSLFLLAWTGNPFEWVRAQEAWGRTFHPAAFITQRMSEIDRSGFRDYLRANGPDVAMLFCVALAAWACFWFARQRQWLYAALVAAYLLPAIVTNAPSVGRMTAVMFPVSLMLVQVSRPRAWLALALLFGAAQLWLAARHFIWLPPY
jgi:hypothetical protein